MYKDRPLINIMNISDNVLTIKGVGEKTAGLLKKLNIETIKDLIFYIPRDFIILDEPVVPSEIYANQVVSICVYFKTASFSSTKKGHLTYSHVTATCNGRNIYLCFFNMPYLKKQLKPDVEYVIRGTLEIGSRGALSMVQPAVYTYEQYEQEKNVLQPLYPLTKGLSNKTLSKVILNAINTITIPEDGLDDYKEGCISFSDAIKGIHHPENYNAFLLARERIVFHEFVAFLLQMHIDNPSMDIPFKGMMLETAQTARLLEQLPYKLTNAQLRTWNDICNDMTSGICMNRLIQGDVGSGKTILAFLALILNASNNHQGVLMAPTEVLAKQHYENICDLKNRYHIDIEPVLLVGSMTAKAKKEIHDKIAKKHCNIIIGTHALIQTKVEYADLTLAITDEQHRFGVKQREELINKSSDIHVCVMSATPIPRSLAMILYGNTSISVIDELPLNRLPIKNCVVGTQYRKKAYEFIKEQIHQGHQAYIICPQIEDNSDNELENVYDYCEKLKEVMPNDINIAYLHGKMKSEQKNDIMLSFKERNIDILVSTTVIEVGIDVPNATVMLIENSERFGLAQLHQLRGRVGRGKAQSYCIFISSKSDSKTMERLDILNKTNDGFKIADEDLRLRGPGDLFGIRQSGEFGFQIGDIYQDSEILKEANTAVHKLLKPENSLLLEDVLSNLKSTSLNTVDFRTI